MSLCSCFVLLSLECFDCFDFVCRNCSLKRIERASMPVRRGPRVNITNETTGSACGGSLNVFKSFWWVSSWHRVMTL